MGDNGPEVLGVALNNLGLRSKERFVLPMNAMTRRPTKSRQWQCQSEALVTKKMASIMLLVMAFLIASSGTHCFAQMKTSACQSSPSAHFNLSLPIQTQVAGITLPNSSRRAIVSMNRHVFE
jgi:hypothetical protein